MVILVEDDGADVDVNRDNNKRPYFTLYNIIEKNKSETNRNEEFVVANLTINYSQADAITNQYKEILRAENTESRVCVGKEQII